MSNLTESQLNMLLKQKTSVFVENNHINSFINFWLYVFKKLIFSIISVKVLAFILLIYMCRELLIEGYLNGANFSAILICLIPAFFAAREYSKSSNNSATSTILNNPVVQSIKDKIFNESEEPEELDD